MFVKYLYAWRPQRIIAWRNHVFPQICSLCRNQIACGEWYTKWYRKPLCWSCYPFVKIEGKVGENQLKTVGLPPLTEQHRREIPDLPTREKKA